MDISDTEMLIRRKIDQMKQFNENFKKSLKSAEQPPPGKAISAAPKPLMNAEALDQLISVSNHVVERQSRVVEQERDCQQSMWKIDKEIARMKAEYSTLTNTLEEMQKLDIKMELAALKKAKANYSSALDVEIHTRDLEDGEHFVAVVKFSTGEGGNTINLTINRSTRTVTAFDASQIMSQVEAAELQRAVTVQEGRIDLRKLIAIVRPMCRETTT
ncbi:hypothetical protein HUJ04_013394 [Dendroctonus ponderosae]|uniref:Kinetochore protein SPC25 n=2 Tax=Dendroctonus ponderosae TaxID=77166 RepID=A0AAR5Q2T0_DENPD|nr:hypothetical protein HUJ04_013394 [Dendroctonus ponderosae]